MKKKTGHTNTTGILLLLVFIFFLTIISCKKSNAPSPVVTVTPPLNNDPLDTAITDSAFYMDITLNGQRVLGVINGLGNQWSWGIIGPGLLADSNTYTHNRVGVIFVPATKSQLPMFAFSKGSILFDALLPDYQSINTTNSFFAPGNYGYSVHTHDTTYDRIPGTIIVFPTPITQTLLSDGANIFWQDSTGKAWETCFGTADQTGSYFTIVKNEPGSQTDYPGYVNGTIVTAKFDCNLYDGLGNKMHLTNGRFRLTLLF
jgi:hypothetical protein